ncbi:hypothetical protein N9W89_01200 [Hellea sp.]|nr:hypothetical protein [Hellea sp.]
MQKFEGISFLWAVALLALIGLGYGVRAIIGYRQIAKDAEQDYDYKQERGMLDGSLSREGYIKLFKRLHNPRRPAYIALGIFAILILTWPIMGLLSVLLEQLYQLSGRNRVFEPGFLVWQFSIFFGIIFSWTAIAYAIARRYHLLAPGTTKYETEQQIKEEKTGQRDKVVIANDWGIPPFLAIIGFVVFIIFVIWWKLW